MALEWWETTLETCSRYEKHSQETRLCISKNEGRATSRNGKISGKVSKNWKKRCLEQAGQMYRSKWHVQCTSWRLWCKWLFFHVDSWRREKHGARAIIGFLRGPWSEKVETNEQRSERGEQSEVNGSSTLRLGVQNVVLLMVWVDAQNCAPRRGREALFQKNI